MSSISGQEENGGGLRGWRLARRFRRSKRRDADGPAFVVQDGNPAGQRVFITSTMVIGREGADLALDDAKVSSRHAELRLVGRGVEIEDLGSADGTSINGVPIDGPQSLIDGDVVEVGNTRIAMHVPARRVQPTVFPGHEPQAQIVVKSGPLAGRSCRVTTEIVVGRDHADLVLDDALVSRQHAIVRWIGRTLQVEDLLSTNGTRVNRELIVGPQRLEHGDVIAIGPFAIEVQIAPSSEGSARD
jgi:pSer/pThr/pTyr-binding forkhead associated (FHA) protein